MTETQSYGDLAAQISDISTRIERLLSAGKAEREALLDRADYWQGRENGEWVGYANQHSPTKSCALAIRDLKGLALTHADSHAIEKTEGGA